MRLRHGLTALAAALLIAAATAGAAAAACPVADPGPPPGGTDPLMIRQWGLAQIGAATAWDTASGAGATVAVVDTGVDLGHPDLAANLDQGADLWETRPGGVADCPGPQDEDFHGTMVAGTIAATRGNGIGVAGVAPQARVLPVRVRPTVGSMDFSRVGAGIRWAADHGADVISLTGGTIFPIKPAPVVVEDIDDAIAYAWSRGTAIVATAGNNGPLPWCQYPSSTPSVVCAAATDPRGLPALYSQLPVKPGAGVALRAPGGSRLGAPCDAAENVISTTLRGGALAPCDGQPYATDSGTTYATAHIAGVAALLAGVGLTNVQIVDCLRRTSSNRGLWEPVHGFGRVDAAAAVKHCSAG